jgi:hypothetical protein
MVKNVLIAAVLVGAVGLLALLVHSLPDIVRYFKIRRM